MKGIIMGCVIGCATGIVIGWNIGKLEYKNQLSKIAIKIKETQNSKNVQSLEEIVEHFEKILTQKELQIKELQAMNDKTMKKLANLEEQFTHLFNEMIRQEGENAKFSKGGSIFSKGEEQKEKKSPDELIKEINSRMESKDVVGVGKLLKQLVTYGKEYYQFVFDTLRKIFEDSRGGRRFNIGSRELLKVLGSSEFVDYYKWVIENPDIVERQAKWRAIDGLLWAGGEEIKPYLFEQFKSQSDPIIKNIIFNVLSNTEEYKNDFIDIAKNLSEDVELRRRIILEYRNDNSPEVQNLYSFLNSNETDPVLKKIVNIISEVRNNKDTGYVVFKGGDVLKEKDIIIKVGDREINSEHSLWAMSMPFMRESFNSENPNENIPVTLKRSGQVITINVPKSKLPTELRMIAGAYIESR